MCSKMKKRRLFLPVIICAVLLFGFFHSRIFFAQTLDPQNPSEYMSTVDKKHSQEEFQKVLESIQICYPHMPINEIGFFLFSAWSKIQKTYPKVTIYDFAARFEEFIFTMNPDNTFQDVLIAYVKKTINENRQSLKDRLDKRHSVNKTKNRDK